MPFTRRDFMQQASAFALLSRATLAQQQQAMHDHMAMPPQTASAPAAALPPMLNAATLAPFVDPLPMPARLVPVNGKLRIAMREVHAKLHRDVPPTRLWTYAEAASTSPSALAPLIEVRSHQPLQIEWLNQLPGKHFLPIDFTLHGCDRDLPEVRTVTHLHGARVPSKDDGYPTDWFPTGHARTCHYPFQQEAATLWFHDHAMGLNRLNTYAGLFGMALLRDEAEDALELPAGPNELPLLLCDRNLTAAGQLYYPVSPDPERPWVPEFYGDALLVNGKIRPYAELEPRLYRLRVLNASNSRFYQLALSGGEPLHLIGSDQGLLAERVSLKSLLLAPAERADILVDLSAHAGQTLTLNNGLTPMLQLRVGPKSTAQSTLLPTALRSIPPADETAAVVTRQITLNEIQDGVKTPMRMLLNRKAWHEPVTERPRLNTSEIWEFINLTEDTHPMHLHMVRFRVLDRRSFEPFNYQNAGQIKYLAPAIPPDPPEHGWKDIVQCPPGLVTRILVRFEGYTGNYLYHCHVLEHEANDMMRPFEVIA